MGSKYRLLPHLAEVFAAVGGTTAADPFSGSGVVSYLLKCQGYEVTSSDYLNFPTVIARATTANSDVTLGDAEIDAVCGPAADDRDFIRTTFDGLYFTEDDRTFLDSAWSNIDRLPAGQRDLAISALVLSAARRQPRGVFTFTDATRYTDGRRDLKLSLREHFRERIAEYNAVVFDNGRTSQAVCGEVFDVAPGPYDLVYLDPPYAPPADDNDYIKRYHFLEGLSRYWQDATIMHDTKTKKLAKRFTPFAYKRTIEDALLRTFEHFADSGTIVLSYSSNAVPAADRIIELLGKVKSSVEVRAVDHRYSFGTHVTAARRSVQEYIFIGRDE
ncbi:DNA methyltransferase [Blastococcus sp. TF02A-30]|nr:DNA methyltransferase [Blastococcus sp. TF02A-30]